jgi:hypothetical protein
MKAVLEACLGEYRLTTVSAIEHRSSSEMTHHLINSVNTVRLLRCIAINPLCLPIVDSHNKVPMVPSLSPEDPDISTIELECGLSPKC